MAVRLFGCSTHPVSETFGSFSSRPHQKSLQINVEPACATLFAQRVIKGLREKISTPWSPSGFMDTSGQTSSKGASDFSASHCSTLLPFNSLAK